MEPRRGPLTAGEKVQFTDRKGKKITDQLVAGGSTQTEHGLILHDDVIGKTEGTVILTVHAKREAQVNQVYPEKDKNKPWKSSRAIGGWEYAVMPATGRLRAVDAARRADHVSEGHRPSYSARRHPLRHARA